MKNWKSLLGLLLLNLMACGLHAQDTALIRINNLNDDSVKVNALLQYGDYLADSDSRKAGEQYRSALRLCERIHFPLGKAYALLKIGYLEVMGGHYRSAIQNFNAAVTAFTPLNRPNAMGRCLTNIGAVYELIGKPDSAMISYLDCIRLLENTPYRSSLANAYCSVGILYGNSKIYNKAIDYKTRAVTIARQEKDSLLLVETLTELADTYGEMNKAAQGFPFAYEALPIALQRNKSAELGSTFYTISALHLALAHADSAINYATRCRKYALLSGDVNTYIAGSLCLSRGYGLLHRQHDRLKVLQDALQQSRKAGVVLLLDDVYKNLSEASYQVGDYANAYQYFNAYTVYKDSVLNERMSRSVEELEIKYQTDKKERILRENSLELSRKELNLKKARDFLLYTVTALLVALLVVVLLIVLIRYKRRLHQKELEAVVQQRELQQLQALMDGEEKERGRIAKDLHDGVSGMLAAAKMHFSSIQDTPDPALSEGYRQGMRLLNEITAEIRKTSHNLMPEVLLQYGLDEALRRYCNRVSNSRALEVTYDSWGQIDRFSNSFQLSVYRIVQELLNNILKHSQATLALVQLSQHNELLSISIEDNGTGFPENTEGDGMGLASLRQRVEIMNGRMDIESSPHNGVQVHLEFDVSRYRTA